MLSRFKKKNKQEIQNPIDGEVIELSQVSDPVFSQGMMGSGFAINPTSNTIFSPIEGKVIAIFPTKHAITIENKNCSVLLHIGIDTVELNGEGFDIKVKENQKVDSTTILATYDRELIKSNGKEDTLMVLLPEYSEAVEVKSGNLNHGEAIFSI